MSLKGKIAIVTGGTGALGVAIVRRFLAEGVKTTITVRTPQDVLGRKNCWGLRSLLFQPMSLLSRMFNGFSRKSEANSAKLISWSTLSVGSCHGN